MRYELYFIPYNTGRYRVQQCLDSMDYTHSASAVPYRIYNKVLYNMQAAYYD